MLRIEGDQEMETDSPVDQRQRGHNPKRLGD